MPEPTRQQRWTAIQILLVICLLGMVLLVGTEAGRLVTALRVVGAVVGTALIVAYLVRAPRDHDLVDALVLAGLVLFLVTCVTSSTPRLSFEAATTALAYAAAFWVARGALSDPRGRELGVLALGALGTLLGIMFVVNWGAVWIDWTKSYSARSFHSCFFSAACPQTFSVSIEAIAAALKNDRNLTSTSWPPKLYGHP